MRRIYLMAAVIILTAATSLGGPADNIPTSLAQSDGTLILNEISPWPSDGTVWVELINPGDQAIELEGWTIEFLSGFSYTFGEGAGEVAAGGVHVLEITGDNPLNPEGDGCTLSSPDGPTDAITWGIPSAGGSRRLASGEPLMPLTGIIDDNEGLHQSGDVLLRIPDTWPPDVDRWVGSGNWAYRDINSSSRGQRNPYPPPAIISPTDGAYVAADINLLVIGYEFAESIAFQISMDSNFGNVLFERTVDGNSIDIDDLESGTYFWRVSPNDGQSWTQAFQFTRAGYDIDELIVESAENKGGQVPSGITATPDATCTASHIIPCPHIMQNKDTTMLCLDGCNMTGNCAWCDAHAALQASGGWRYNCEHGRYNCARACLSMIAAAGGCSLSQDRIQYYIFEESGPGNLNTNKVGYLNDPRGDLFHIGTYLGVLPMTLDWVYQYTGHAGSYNSGYGVQIFDDGDRSDMDSIREFIDHDRIVMRHSKKHSTIITGYAIVREGGGSEIVWILVQNPASNRADHWLSLESTKAEYRAFTFPPQTGRPSRNDELEIDVDTDGDGIFDFDELRRFGTLPGDVDTDGDGVHDMQDIVGYVFEPDGVWFPVDPDIDADGARKESDPDNDRATNNGSSDGCEDANQNGFFDSNGLETDCFVTSDDFTVSNPDCFFGFIRYYVHSNLCDDTIEEIILREGVMGSGQMVHSFRWEHYMCVGAELSGETYASALGQTIGTGWASVELISHEDGRYSIDIQTDPATATMIIEWNMFGEVSQMSNDSPVFLNLLELGPDKVGFPEETPGGGLVLRGYMDLLEPQYNYLPSQLENLTEAEITEREQLHAEMDAEASVEWEIWLQAPSN